MKSFSKIFILVLSLSPLGISSKSIVLINGIPTTVILDGSEIKEIKGEVSTYLSGFDKLKSADKFQYANLRIDSQDSAEVVEPSSLVISKSKVSDSPIVSGNYFKFDADSALLSELAINDIKDHASKIKAGKASSILLESFHLAESDKSIELVQNRLEACKKYFEINGVPSNSIVTNMYPNDKQSDKVSVTLR